MFLLGHLGIGKKVAQPFSKGLSTRIILLGTILPDLIDKPLYYSIAWATGKQAHELGLISGTRTFGHTALFLLFIVLLGAAKKSRFLAALSLGITTHLLLDGLLDHFSNPALEAQNFSS